MAKQVFNVDYAKQQYPGLTDTQIDAFISANPNMVRSDQTFGYKADRGTYNFLFGKRPEDIGLLKRTHRLFEKAIERPEELASYQWKQKTQREVQDLRKQGKNLAALGTAVKALPTQFDFEFREALPAAMELAPFTLAPLKIGKAASAVTPAGKVALRTLPAIAGRVGGAGATAAIQTGMYAATEPGKTGKEKWQQFWRTAPTAAGFSMGISALGEGAGLMAEKYARKAKEATQLAKERAVGRKAAEKVRAGGMRFEDLPEDVMPEDIDIEKWYPKNTLTDELTPGEKMVVNQLDVGSQKMQSRLKIPQTTKQLVHYGNYGSIDDMYYKNKIAIDQIDDVVNRVSQDPTVVVKVNDIPGVTQGYQSALDGDDFAKAAKDTSKIYSNMIQKGQAKGLPPGYVGLDDAWKAWREVMDYGWEADFLNRPAYGRPTTSQIQMAQLYFDYGDELMNSINKNVGDYQVQNAILPGNKAILNHPSVNMPLLADDMGKATNLRELNSMFAPFLRFNEAVDITRGKYASAISRMARGAADFVAGRPRTLISKLAERTIESPTVQGAGARMMIPAEQTPQFWQNLNIAPKIGQAIAEPIRRTGQGIIQSLGGRE